MYISIYGSENRMKFLFCITDNLWQPLLVLINSIILNNQGELEFYVLYDFISEEHIKIIKNFVAQKRKKICFICVNKNDIYSEYDFLGVRLPIEAYYRIFAIEILKDINKILYLDVDIICNSSLKKFWNMNFDGNYIIGVESKVDVTYEKGKALINCNSPFLNSGVMLMNFKEIRKKFRITDVLDFLESYKQYHYIYADQIFINSYFDGKIKIIEDKYNRKCGEVYGRYEIIDRNEPAILLHWAGSVVKPWSECSDKAYLYDLDIYEKYCHLQELNEDFKERIKYNIVQNENNLWIVLENRYRFARTGPTNQQVLLDYAWQKIKYGNVFEKYLKIKQYKKIVFYGMNNITKILIDELKNSNIKILGIIDRKLLERNYKNIKIMQPIEYRDNYMEYCDLMIVSIVNEYRNIITYLEKLNIIKNIKPVSEMIFSSRQLNNSKLT